MVCLYNAVKVEVEVEVEYAGKRAITRARGRRYGMKG